MKNPKYPLYEHTPLHTTKELLDFCAGKYENKPAFLYAVHKSDIEVSFVQFKNDVEALGTDLFQKGFKNTHIAVFGENSYEWILAHFAVTCGKNAAVPIDKEMEAEDIAGLLRDSDCSAMFFSDTYYDIVQQLQTMNLGIAFFSMKQIPAMIENGKKLISGGDRDYIDLTIDKNDLASIVYTSGTTGKPKGVMLTHNNFCSCMYGASCNAWLTGSSLLILPLHHTFGLVASVYAEMFYGCPIYINRSLKRLLDDFGKCKPQHLLAVPLVVEMLYKNIWLAAEKQGKEKKLKMLIKISDVLLKCGIDLRKKFFRSVLAAFGGNLGMIVSGGAPIDKKHIMFFNSLGITVLNGYGITECGPIVSVHRDKYQILGSVGVPLCCNEVKIADDGEILVKGDNVMHGYYHNDEENRNAFVDGWFRTGDIGFFDEYGELHITGRIKNLIILGNGENIPAEGVESEIYKIPYVKECIVYGEKNMIVAEVYLDEDMEDAKERIESDIRLLNRRLPQARNIGKVTIRDTEFPKTTTKKIKRDYGRA